MPKTSRSCPCSRSGNWVMSATLAAVALTVWTMLRSGTIVDGSSAQVVVLKDWLKVVMTIGFNEWRLSDDWSCDERHRDCLLPEVSSQRTPGPCWEQLSADLIEISQRKHGLRPCQVLGQAAVSHFGEAPQLLDYAKGVFAARPGPRTRPVDHPPARAQRPFRGRTPIIFPASVAIFRNKGGAVQL